MGEIERKSGNGERIEKREKGVRGEIERERERERKRERERVEREWIKS